MEKHHQKGHRKFQGRRFPVQKFMLRFLSSDKIVDVPAKEINDSKELRNDEVKEVETNKEISNGDQQNSKDTGAVVKGNGDIVNIKDWVERAFVTTGGNKEVHSDQIMEGQDQSTGEMQDPYNKTREVEKPGDQNQNMSSKRIENSSNTVAVVPSETVNMIVNSKQQEEEVSSSGQTSNISYKEQHEEHNLIFSSQDKVSPVTGVDSQ
ncbi:hypothetical protein K7X08_000098 [Anisodus acutangulus]|uniref:Uncharacterized protein n=1 Tax=Anisodus acutangulus TaxID=402998 RepID=A0A9Q1M3Q0_9SOLA|nr:hypothetical protein K7X08_000098 [Anisodus acutangulus]